MAGFGLCTFIALAAPLIGRLSDRLDRKLLFQGALLLLAVDSIALAIAPTFVVALSLRVLGGIASAALIPTVFALIADYVPSNKRAGIMGRVMFGMTLGIAGGPTLAGLATDWLGWQAPYMISAVACLGAFLISRSALERLPKNAEKNEEKATVASRFPKNVALPLLAKALWNGLGVTIFLLAGELLRWHHPGISTSEVGIALLGFGAGLACGNFAVSRLIKLFGADEIVVLLATGFLLVAPILLLDCASLPVAAIALAILGFALGNAAAASTSLLSERAGSQRGLILAISESMNNVVVLSALPIATYLLENGGPTAVLPLMFSGLSIATILGAVDVWRNKKLAVR